MSIIQNTPIFSGIYENDFWGCGSGPGSNLKDCKPYIEFLEKFIVNYNISSIADLGCGDWQFSSSINWGSARYIGYDVVESVVNQNNLRFKANTVSFKHLTDYNELAKADLLVCKDVLQHLSRVQVSGIVNQVFPSYKYILLTNCVPPYSNLKVALSTLRHRRSIYNHDIADGEFTYFDPSRPPYSLHFKKVLTWYSSDYDTKVLNRLSPLRSIMTQHALWKKSTFLAVN